MPMFPKIVDTLSLSMKAANLRHQVLSNNIANVNVPEFQGHDVAFEEQLKKALDGSGSADEPAVAVQVLHPLHIPIPAGSGQPAAPEPRIVPLGGHMRQDGNTVDVEAQMAKMAANQLWYQALVRSVSDEFNRLRTAITEGRR